VGSGVLLNNKIDKRENTRRGASHRSPGTCWGEVCTDLKETRTEERGGGNTRVDKVEERGSRRCWAPRMGTGFY
jgi:hypothetical protein